MTPTNDQQMYTTLEDLYNEAVWKRLKRGCYKTARSLICRRIKLQASWAQAHGEDR